MCDATDDVTNASQGWQITIDLTLVILAALASVTVATSAEYYNQIRKAQREYEKAKNTVEDIVMSFHRELKREAEKIDLVAFKIEGNFARADEGIKKADNLEKRLTPIEGQVNVVSQSLKLTSTSILSGLAGLETKIQDIEAAQEAVKVKIIGFEEQIQKLSAPPEVQVETLMPVMPIKRDKAMAALTETEIIVLEKLSSEGPKTAPEIKEQVHLSREHTARLMKKLYEGGYVEREAGKIPFKYTIKSEMEKLLKKTEETPAT
ncbi:MAG: helix-turn-helix domain-containing protein [Candidatus Bathyarchaeia archaeon]